MADTTSPGLASRIDAVTVYRQGALIRRVARLESEGGTFPRQIRLTGLPLALDDSSVRVSIAGDEPPRAINTRIALEVPPPDEALPPPEDAEVEGARRDEALAAAEVERLEREQAMIGRLEPPARPEGEEGKPPPPVPAEGRAALIRFRREQTERIATALDEARRQRRRAQQQRKHLEARRKEASTARQARKEELRKSVVVELEAGGGGTAAELTVEYVVPGARWAPAYSLHLSEQASKAVVAVRGVVCQRTGEDWSDVGMTLSTAHAQRWSELPELTALRIGRRQPVRARTGWRPPPVGAGALYGDYDRGFGPPEADESPAYALPQLRPADFDVEVEVDEDYEDDSVDLLFDAATPPGQVDVAEAFEEAEAYPEEAPRAEMMSMSAMEAPMPPPAPMMAAPAMSMAPMRSRKSAAPMAKESSRNAPPRGAMAFAGGGARPRPAREEAEAAELAAERDLLDYGNLEMPPPGRRSRGRLRRADPREAYLALLVQQKISLTFDTFVVIQAAMEQAQSLPGLPTGYQPPRDDDGYDYAYVSAGRVDVPSDGHYHGLVLEECAAASAPWYVTVPRESQDVFRMVRLENPLASPLLNGPIDIYLDEAFLMTGRVRHTPARGHVELGLGVEQGIKVARNARFEEETAGLMRGSRELKHHVEVELSNQTGRRAHIEVRERIPVTREKEEDIEVKVDGVKPPWETWEPEQRPLRGGHRWQVDVDSGASVTLSLDYTVKIPAKQELVGGNRRES